MCLFSKPASVTFCIICYRCLFPQPDSLSLCIICYRLSPRPASNVVCHVLQVFVPPRPLSHVSCHLLQVFDSKSEMLVHSQQVHKQDPKPYKCSTCHKSFANSSYLSQHTRIHAGVKPYKCQICERRFTQLCHLQQHIRTHTGEKPYKCQHPGCGKAFSQLSNLQSHSRSHMTDRPYRCNSCYKCFADEQSLREHIPKHSDTKHLKTHICRVCGKSYTQETYLARHMTKHSGEGTPSPRTPVMTKPVPTMPLMMMRHQGDSLDVKCEIDGTGCETMSSDVMNRPSSAFMPLAHQYANASLLNSTVPSTFTFPPPPHMPSSQLSHLSSSSTPSRYFPFDPFPKRDMMDRRLNMSREGVIADSLLSLQQIKNFATSHPVFPKSEPSSPLNKDFP
ncbi:hypothetical protein NP493_10g02004 [Ridgeia piscesae]|uniref:C2H2-type domain-containing protein n=1 Tax=Ridgeia piscesae TaxID=27915 RepID=A0AAD9ULD1_RIDPI|nr:hypothetical protein NP493_10g02004 [Ridgeia piscesae]